MLDPNRFHLMFCTSPTYQVSVPFGSVRVSVPLMGKLESDASLTVESVDLDILTRHVLLMSSGIVHEYGVASSAIPDTITLPGGYVEPPSVE